MKDLPKSEKNVSLCIERAPDSTFYTAKICAENGDEHATSNFQYELDASIFTRLEDSTKKNIKTNAEMIRKFGDDLFNYVFHGAIPARYQSLSDYRIRLNLIIDRHEGLVDFGSPILYSGHPNAIFPDCDTAAAA